MTGAQREELVRLYEAAIGEYEFQVTLNSNRVQYYLVLNAALASAGLGLIDIHETPRLVLSLFIFGLGAIVAAGSRVANGTGHEYYTHIRERIGRLERDLNIEPYGLRTTRGMRREGQTAAPDDATRRRWRAFRGRKRTITSFNDGLFRAFFWVNVLLVISSLTFLVVGLWPHPTRYAVARPGSAGVHATPVIAVNSRADALEVEVVYLGGNDHCGRLDHVTTAYKKLPEITVFIGASGAGSCSHGVHPVRTLVRLPKPLGALKIRDGATGRTITLTIG